MDGSLQETVAHFANLEPRPKAQVTERALYQRINRKLLHEGKQLRTTRSQRAELELGRYYCVNVLQNCIHASHVDLEAWGHDLEVLPEWEELREHNTTPPTKGKGN